MKFIKLIIVISLFCQSCSSGNDLKKQEYIQIHVRETWLITVSKTGSISINSMIDSSPMSMAHTTDKAISYEVVMESLLKEQIGDDKEKQVESVWALIPGNEKKRPVTEALLFKILSESSNKWEFPGLNGRLIELLRKKPILKNIEEQSKALHPTEGAVVPK